VERAALARARPEHQVIEAGGGAGGRCVVSSDRTSTRYVGEGGSASVRGRSRTGLTAVRLQSVGQRVAMKGDAS
jgi:hypothetical protein